MTTYTITGPDGKDYSIDGPPGQSQAQVVAQIQQHQGQQTPGLAKSAASGLIQGAGAPGDLSNRVLGNAPPQQPIDQGTYYGKLVDALNMARKHLELPTTPQVGDAVGMQPTTPVTGAETAVQRGASMIPGAIMGGNPAGRAMMGAAPAANAVRGMGMSPQGPASSVKGGAAANSPEAVGPALQTQLLRQGLEHGAGTIGHVLGGPLGGMAGKAIARYGPKMLGFE